MSVGNQQTKQGMDNALTSLSMQLQTIMQQIRQVSQQVNGQGNGLAYLEGIGYTNTANPANPGSQSDAAWALQALGYLNQLASIHDGSQNLAGAFNFQNALSLLRQI